MVVRTDRLLETATRVLVAFPSASLGDVAAAAGVSRTTLHSRFATREALLTALAHEALDLVEDAYAQARLGEGTVPDALGRALELLVPLGPRLEFLLRERALDDVAELTRRYAEVDQPLIELVQRGQRDQSMRSDLPAWWQVAVVVNTVYAAWEAIADGRLAARDATRVILASVLDGATPR